MAGIRLGLLAGVQAAWARPPVAVATANASPLEAHEEHGSRLVICAAGGRTGFWYPVGFPGRLLACAIYLSVLLAFACVALDSRPLPFPRASLSYTSSSWFLLLLR